VHQAAFETARADAAKANAELEQSQKVVQEKDEQLQRLQAVVGELRATVEADVEAAMREAAHRCVLRLRPA